MLSVVVLTGLLQQKNSNFESVMRRKFAATGMSASKFSVQFGRRCNWRISMLKVLHAGNVLCVGVFIIRAGFRSPLRRFWLKYWMKRSSAVEL